MCSSSKATAGSQQGYRLKRVTGANSTSASLQFCYIVVPEGEMHIHTVEKLRFTLHGYKIVAKLKCGFHTIA